MTVGHWFILELCASLIKSENDGQLIKKKEKSGHVFVKASILAQT